MLSSQTLTREREETKNEEPLNNNKIYKVPEVPKLELDDRLVNVQREQRGTEGEQILEDDFLRVKELEEKSIDEIKEEYQFDKIKDAFDEGTIPPQLDFFYGGKQLSENFICVCNFLLFNNEIIGFVDILCSYRAQSFMANNSLSIHAESGNTFTRISTQTKIFIVSF